MRTNDGKLLDALAIRDTDPHNSSSISNTLTGKTLFVCHNTLNEAVSLQYQGSVDGTTWVNAGSAIAVSASTGTDASELTAGWKYFRVIATCTVGPASGSLTVFWFWQEGVI